MILSLSLNATEVNYSSALRYGAYDNLNLEPEVNSPQKEESASIIGELFIFEDSANQTTRFDSSLELINYKSDRNSDRDILNLLLDSLWRIRPGFFEWSLSDVFTQTAIDVLEADAIDNRQDINVFTTGPNFFLRLNPKNLFNIEFRLQLNRFEIDETDNSRLTGQSYYQYKANSLLNLRANFEAERVKFEDDELNTNYNRNDFFISSTYTSARNVYDLEIGTTLVLFDDADIEDLKRSRYRLSVTRINSRDSSTQLLIRRSVEDTASNLNNGLLSDNAPVIRSSGSDLYLNEAFHLVYDYRSSMGNLAIEPYVNINSYQEQSDLDVKQAGMLLTTSYNISRVSTLGLDLQYLDSDFVNIESDRVDEDMIFRANYIYRARRNLNFIIEVIKQERESTQEDASYEDLRFFVSIEYTSI